MLYTGPLSQAAQQILAALRAQSPARGRPGQNRHSDRRQTERFNSSQSAAWNIEERFTDRPRPQVSSLPVPHRNSSDESRSARDGGGYQRSQTPDGSLSSQASSCSAPCWDFSPQSQTSPAEVRYQSSQADDDRKRAEPPASGRTPSFSQDVVSETASSSCHRDRATLILQIPETPEHQAASCRNSTEEIKPSFILSLSPDDDGPEEFLFPKLRHHDPFPVSAPLQVETHDLISYMQSFHDSCEEVTNRAEDGDTVTSPCDFACSPKVMQHKEELINMIQEDAGQTSVFKHSMRDEAPLHVEGSTDGMGGTSVWGSSDGSAFDRDSNLLPDVAETIVDCDSGSEKLEEKTGKDKEKEVLTSETEDECPAGTENQSLTVGHENRMSPEDTRLTVNDFHTEGPLLDSESITSVLGDSRDNDPERQRAMEVGFETESKTKTGADTSADHKMETAEPQTSDVLLKTTQGETNEGKAFNFPEINTEPEEEETPVSGENKEDSGRGRCPPSSSGGSGFRPPRLGANVLQTPPGGTTGSFPVKRKNEELQHQSAKRPPKICLTWRPPPFKPPCSSQEKTVEEEMGSWKKLSAPEQEVHSDKTETVFGVHAEPASLKKSQQVKKNLAGKASKQTLGKRRSTKCPTNATKPTREEEKTQDHPQTQTKAVCLTAALTSDPRVKDSGKMTAEERMQTLQQAGRAEALLLTMVHRDGTTQLDAEQKLSPPVCGLLLLLLMKSDRTRDTPEDALGPGDCLVYLKLEHTPAWAQQHTQESQQLYTRDLLLQVLSGSQLVVCYKAKDLLRTALHTYKQHLHWKQVAGCRIQDPQVSGWLLDPADSSSCFQDLLHKHCREAHQAPSLGSHKVSQVISGLYRLLRLHTQLQLKLQSQRLWQLYSDMELHMIPVLAAMESHHIHVDKEALKKTSDLLGTKMKQLEQEAHRAAGQIFLLTSNTQLRIVLFEKLRLHERCENKKLPKTLNKQQQSTSEAALLQLQELHPLPKIILEYRQVHKIKSTFVDGILSCMMNKSCISSTWLQTSAVTGRISAKHPNFQALPRQPLQITKRQYVQGKEEEVVSVHPRAMFVPQEGWSFLAADFCQVELRLLAHLSSDPELLCIFNNPQADVFTMLASQWKGVSEGEVTSEDREHAKRIVYSVVYGAGRERLSGILGVSSEQASRFHDSFLQTYRDVQAFVQRTVQQSHKQGYVLSIMGRRRNLPHINSPDWAVRMQAERQAVNFVVQGSAADLCKTAMIRIFHLVASSPSLSARLVAQLHDELLYEVEDSQLEQFAALVKKTMESLQHMDHIGVHLQVPLKVAVSSGRSWGSMRELNVPP